MAFYESLNLITTNLNMFKQDDLVLKIINDKPRWWKKKVCIVLVQTMKCVRTWYWNKLVEIVSLPWERRRGEENVREPPLSRMFCSSSTPFYGLNKSYLYTTQQLSCLLLLSVGLLNRWLRLYSYKVQYLLHLSFRDLLRTAVIKVPNIWHYTVHPIHHDKFTCENATCYERNATIYVFSV